MNYTEEQAKYMVDYYVNASDKPKAVLELAEHFNKPKKSIIGKLSKEGVYEKQGYKTKTGQLPITKKELIGNFCLKHNINPEKVQGLEKTPKLDLQYFLDELENRLDN